MKRIIPLILISIIVVALAVVAGVLWNKNNSLHDTISARDDTISAQQKALDIHRQAEQKLWLQNGKERFGMGMQKVATTDTTDYVYLPELQIRLPYGQLAASLQYAMRANTGVGGGMKPTEADVTSSQYVRPTTPTTMDCSNLVRIEINNQSEPYSPQESPTSVKLGDGRTLQIYEFGNDAQCQPSWASSVSPAQVTTVFKQASSY